MKKVIILIILIIFAALLIALSLLFNEKYYLAVKYGFSTPKEWSETATGVKTHIKTDKKILALTMDACGSDGDNLDEDLIAFLTKEKIPATVFITGKWIAKYPAKFKKLAQNPLFEIENHGIHHKPSSLTGNFAWGIKGTENALELYDEIAANSAKIAAITGRKPMFFRSGTAYYDEQAVKLITDMGYQVIGFTILGDKGASYSAKEVEQALLSAKPGHIIICHMNHPEKETGKGLMAVLPKLKAQGFKFIQLKDYADKLK